MDKSNRSSRKVLRIRPRRLILGIPLRKVGKLSFNGASLFENLHLSNHRVFRGLTAPNLNRKRNVATTMLPGVKVQELRKNVDERGFFAEIFREDWRDLLGEDKVVQSNLSYSFPGVIRAWHRHSRGQVDYIVVLRGTVKICAYDDTPASPTRGELSEVETGGERLEVVRIPGSYWHGTKNLGNEPSLTAYFMNRLYNAKNPDEERRPWNDPTIIDPRVSKSYDWNKPSHK